MSSSLDKQSVSVMPRSLAVFEVLTQTNHIHSHHINQTGLCSICCTTINFCPILIIRHQHKQGDCRPKLCLALLLSDLNIRRIKLTIPVLLYHPENVTNNLYLPIK